MFKTKCKQTHPHTIMRKKDAQNGFDFHFKKLCFKNILPP